MYGLTAEEVDASRERHGSNALTEQKTETFWHKLLSNFRDPMIEILIVALIIDVVFAFLGQTEWYEALGIAVAVIIATLVSTLSEYRNENAFQRLQEEASRIVCKVYRDGTLDEVSINDLVVGDAVVVQTGDKVPADGFIIDGELAIDQSVLNGESEEVEKAVAPDGFDAEGSADFLDACSIFRGSIAVSGDAVMQITCVGDETVYGSIADELQEDTERDSPLKVKLSDLARTISRIGYIGGILIMLAYLFRSIVIANGFDAAAIAAYCSSWMTVVGDIIEAVMLGVIIVVVVVPEGLPMMIAIVSSLNMRKMLKDNVLVRKINAIETAGSLNILFTDKTGTLTKGHLEVVTFFDGGGQDYDALADIPAPLEGLLRTNALVNTDALVTDEEGAPKAVGGNATERALLDFYLDDAGDGADAKALPSAVSEIPFSSDRKYSAIALDADGAPDIDGQTMPVLVKGAPERILEHCASYLDAAGNVEPLDADLINAKIDELADKAIRVLAFAACDGTIADEQISEESGWILTGLVGIRDDIRPEVIDAVAEAQGAGVQVVMITGDRKETARAIACDIGLMHDDENELVITSEDLAAMSDEEVGEALGRLRVVARALPGDKSRLVRIAQEHNLVVGMTGDGVNDSPALKAADVGFAMGSGTEVAKEAAGISILDDDFASIEQAILYGRTIFNSIRKFIIFQLTINISAVLISFIFPLIGFEGTPLTITQILWINLIMDTLAALAFGGEPALRRFMHEQPKQRDESIITGRMWSSILVGAAWTLLLSLLFLLTPFVRDFFASQQSGDLMTGYFCLFVFLAVFNAFNARTERLNLFDNIGMNRGFLQIIALIVVVQVLLAYLGGAVFGCYGLSLAEWGFVLVGAFTIIPVDLIRKLIVGRASGSAD